MVRRRKTSVHVLLDNETILRPENPPFIKSCKLIGFRPVCSEPDLLDPRVIDYDTLHPFVRELKKVV